MASGEEANDELGANTLLGFNLNSSGEQLYQVLAYAESQPHAMFVEALVFLQFREVNEEVLDAFRGHACAEVLD